MIIMSPIRNAVFSAVRSVFDMSRGGSAPFPIDDVGGVAPAFAYGIIKLRSAYSGNSLRVLRSSDSAELDIGFTGNNLDITSLNTFLGSEVGRVLKYYDQSGNGNDTATQTTDTLRNAIRVDATDSNNVILGTTTTRSIYDLPSISFDKRNTSVYSVIATSGGASGIIRLGPGGAPFQFNHSVGTLYNTSPTLYSQMQPAIYEYLLSAASTIQSINEETRTGSAQTAGSVSGGSLGFTDSGYSFSGLAFAYIGYTRTLDSTERSAIKTSLNSRFNIGNTASARVIYVGDSITAGSNDVFSYGYSKRSMRKLPNTARSYHNAGGGQHIQTYVSGYASSVAKSILTTYTGTRIVFLHMGTNDLTIGARTAAQIYADIQSYAALVRADGALIIVSTILPQSGWNGTQQTTRADLNTLISANWASFADGFCDLGGNATMGDQADASDTTLYADGTHPTSLGHSILEPLVTASISALL